VVLAPGLCVGGGFIVRSFVRSFVWRTNAERTPNEHRKTENGVRRFVVVHCSLFGCCSVVRWRVRWFGGSTVRWFDYSLFAVRCSLLVVRCSLLVARCSLLVARCSSFAQLFRCSLSLWLLNVSLFVGVVVVCSLRRCSWSRLLWRR